MNALQDDDKWDRATQVQLLSGPGVPTSRTFIGRWALTRMSAGSATTAPSSSSFSRRGKGRREVRFPLVQAGEHEQLRRIRAVCSAWKSRGAPISA